MFQIYCVRRFGPVLRAEAWPLAKKAFDWLLRAAMLQEAMEAAKVEEEELRVLGELGADGRCESSCTGLPRRSRRRRRRWRSPMFSALLPA